MSADQQLYLEIINVSQNISHQKLIIILNVINSIKLDEDWMKYIKILKQSLNCKLFTVS